MFACSSETVPSRIDMGRRRLASSLWFAALVSASLTAAFQAPRPPRAATFRRVAKLSDEVEDAVEKGGVEGGLFSIFKSDGDGESKGADAKALLAKYGAAYLATSISLALVSFSICYLLIDSGVDAAALLARVGIDATAATEKGTTIAIAYAVHKAASPIRFPPTVALTPVVAKLLKGDAADDDDE